MRLLTDHDVFAVTVRALREWGHDVSTAALLGLAQHTDDDLLTAARDAGRVLITRDKDFGSLVFLRRPDSLGVILLRVSPVTLAGVHVQLRGLLEGVGDASLAGTFCVVEGHRYRIRRPR